MFRIYHGVRAYSDGQHICNVVLASGTAVQLETATGNTLVAATGTPLGFLQKSITADGPSDFEREHLVGVDAFEAITGSNKLGEVLEGIAVARAVGLYPVKLNVVVMAGINEDELLDFGAKTISDEWHVRFIEFMPVAGVGTIASQFVSVSDMRKRLEQLGELEPCLPGIGNGPAKYFHFPRANGTIGFITPVSEHFCIFCNRLRLTADGTLRSCLLSEDEIDLKQPLRSGVSLSALKELIESAVKSKPLRHRLAEGYVPKDRPFSQVGG